MSYTIHARGKEGSEEDIKVVSRIPGKNGAKGFQLHFPCLSVHVLGSDDDHDMEYYCVTWSNNHDRPIKVNDVTVKDYEPLPPEEGGPQRTANPGTFKIKRVENTHLMISVMNDNRKMTYSRAAFQGGKPMYDLVEMAKRWGTTMNLKGEWDYGKNHPMERAEELLAESASIDGIERELTKRFGDFGETILELFVEHELFLKYLTAETAELIAA